MPKDYVYETAITIDHEAGVMLVDTSVNGVASQLLRGGVDIYAVSKLLRHASVVMSERYAHLSQADLKAAVERQWSTDGRVGSGKME